LSAQLSNGSRSHSSRSHQLKEPAPGHSPTILATFLTVFLLHDLSPPMVFQRVRACALKRLGA
jgi:hypothetical protein